MNKSMTLVTLAVTALLAAPIGAANWGSYGDSEPSTTYDTPSFMWAQEPTAGQVRVYFNAYLTSGPGIAKGMNLNVGAAQTQIEGGGIEQIWALMGVWTDCNGDGYVGLAETAALEYRADLLIGGGPCTPKTGPTNCYKSLAIGERCGDWPATGFNNYNGWVSELIPVVGPSARVSGDVRLMRDSEAAVWADRGRPDEPATTSGGGTCAINPLPRGTLQSSGGLLNYADCRAAVLERWNTAMDAAGDPLGLRFADDDDGRSGTVGQQETLGGRWDDPDRSNEPIVKAFDCDQSPGPGGVRPPSTSVNPDGSIAGTINYTIEAGPFPERAGTSEHSGPASTSNCDFSDDRGDEPYSIFESDFNGTSTQRKTSSNWNFDVEVATRGGAPLGLAQRGEAGMANDAGLTPFAAVCIVCSPTEWVTNVNTIKGGFRTVQNRGGTGVDNPPDVGFADAYWITTYARVGADTTGKGIAVPGGSGQYGRASTQCGQFTSGVHNGWDCDAANWNVNPDGSPVEADGLILSYPGLSYNLRDADCYDGEIRGTGVGIQPAFFGPEPCRPTP